MLSNTKYERDFGSYFYEFCLSMKIVLGLPKDLKEKWGTKYRSLFFILGINLLIMVFIYGYYSINKDCPLFCLVFFVVLVFGHFVLFCMLCFFFPCSVYISLECCSIGVIIAEQWSYGDEYLQKLFISR